jgi:hypothetical protein
MSYYTGLNELNLIPLRQFTATHSNALSDHDVQQLVQRDIRMILTHWRELRPTLARHTRMPSLRQNNFLKA